MCNSEGNARPSHEPEVWSSAFTRSGPPEGGTPNRLPDYWQIHGPNAFQKNGDCPCPDRDERVDTEFFEANAVPAPVSLVVFGGLCACFCFRVALGSGDMAEGNPTPLAARRGLRALPQRLCVRAITLNNYD